MQKILISICNWKYKKTRNNSGFFIGFGINGDDHRLREHDHDEVRLLLQRELQ
jgi:hypothetical protein